MVDILHSAIPDGERHEPKGASGASSGDILIADGVGGTSWVGRNVPDASAASDEQVFTADGLGGAAFAFPKFYMNYYIDNLNPAGTAYIACPENGDLVKVYSVIDDSFSGADTNISFTINAVGVTNGTITITQSGSAAGDVDNSTPTANNSLSAGDFIQIDWDGLASSAVACTLTFAIQRT